MTDGAQETTSRQARAAETKRSRTREKLINAADYVLREAGWNATVDAISGEAGISTATFYTFYGSRNLLCMDAFTELVLKPLEATSPYDRSPYETARALTKLCEGRRQLVAAALAGRLEADQFSRVHRLEAEFGRTFSGECLLVRLEDEPGIDPDFVDRVAVALWQTTAVDKDATHIEDLMMTLRAMALDVLDNIALGRFPDYNAVQRAIERSYSGKG